MGEPTMEALAKRLHRLERENLRLKLVGVVALVVMAAVSCTTALKGQPTPSTVAKVVEAEQFILRDSKGRMRGSFMLTNDAPGLILRDEDGRGRIGLGVTANGDANLQLTSKDSNSIDLRVKNDGTRGLRIQDEHWRPRVTLWVTPRETEVLLYDEHGKVIWRAP